MNLEELIGEPGIFPEQPLQLFRMLQGAKGVLKPPPSGILGFLGGRIDGRWGLDRRFGLWLRVGGMVFAVDLVASN